MKTLLLYKLIKTTRRLVFDIWYQDASVTYMGEDDGPYFKFVATNGYEVISRSRMDIQTERIWLLGAKKDDEARSGTMVFADNVKRNVAYKKFIDAINEWAAHNNGIAINLEDLPVEFDDKATAWRGVHVEGDYLYYDEFPKDLTEEQRRQLGIEPLYNKPYRLVHEEQRQLLLDDIIKTMQERRKDWMINPLHVQIVDAVLRECVRAVESFKESNVPVDKN